LTVTGGVDAVFIGFFTLAAVNGFRYWVRTKKWRVFRPKGGRVWRHDFTDFGKVATLQNFEVVTTVYVNGERQHTRLRFASSTIFPPDATSVHCRTLEVNPGAVIDH